jgi:hypothetical protein
MKYNPNMTEKPTHDPLGWELRTCSQVGEVRDEAKFTPRKCLPKVKAKSFMGLFE